MESTDDAVGAIPDRVETLPALIIRVGGESFAVQGEDGPVTIGREFPAQIQIADPRISRNHLRIEARDGKWIGTDYSTNGTYHAGTRERSLVLVDGMSVQLGNADGLPVHFAFDAAFEASRNELRADPLLGGGGEGRYRTP